MLLLYDNHTNEVSLKNGKDQQKTGETGTKGKEVVFREESESGPLRAEG